MPHAPNAIGNAIDALGWTHTIIAGRRRKNAQKYSNWRNEVETKIKTKGWLWKKDGGNLYDAFVLECVALADFPVSVASLIRRNPQMDDSKAAHKALNESILDCFKNIRESQHKSKRAAAGEELPAEAGAIVAGGDEGADAGGRFKRPKYEAGRPVVIYILDSCNAAHRDPMSEDWHWKVARIKKMAFIYDPSVNDLHVKVSAHLADGRKVREIIGALANLVPDAAGVIPTEQVPSDVTHIRSDEDLDAFLRLTEAKPITLLIVLHKLAADGVNTLRPAGSNANTYNFNLGRFHRPEYYVDDIEDSEAEIANRAGGGNKGVPCKDHKFEDRLEDVRRRIRRQQRLLASLEQKHKVIFPAAIHDTDPSGELRLRCYGPTDDLSGKQVVRF